MALLVWQHLRHGLNKSVDEIVAKISTERDKVNYRLGLAVAQLQKIANNEYRENERGYIVYDTEQVLKQIKKS